MTTQEGPQLHSFQPAKLLPQVDGESTVAEEHGNSTLPEDQTMNDTDNEEEHSNILQNEGIVEQDKKEADSTEDEEEDNSGTSVLPLSKIKKIFKTDPEHVLASEAAVFTTAVATELFIQYFTEQASLIARSEKRKKLQYKDFASAASNIEQLHFLSDIVPKTYNLKSLVEGEKVKYAANNANKKEKVLDKNQGVLKFGSKQAEKPTKTKADLETESELQDSDDDQDVGTNYIRPNAEHDGTEEPDAAPEAETSGDEADKTAPPKENETNDQDTDDEQAAPKDKENDVIMQ